VDDGEAAPHLLQLIDPTTFPRLETIVADHKDHHHALLPWMNEHCPLGRIVIKTRPEGVKGVHALGETLGGGTDQRLAWALAAP
jgi:hypothetical protein